MPAPVWLDPRLASTLQHVLAGLPDDLQRAGWDEKLTGLLGQTAHPERALLNLATFTDRLSDPARFWHSATANSRILRVLMSLFAGSQHLSQVLLRHPERWPQLENNTALRHTRSLADYRAELDSLIAQYPERSALTTAMCAWQGWEMLRIGVGDLAGLTDLDTVVRQLSNLAESLVQACLQVCRQGPEPYPDGLTALGMGKLGGQELNYSSDIDLVFLAERHSQTLLRSVEGTIAMLSAVTPEGFMYRVDMRLRPWGKSGPLLPTRAGYLRYLARSARLWELQALLKARPIAGDLALGERFLADVRPLMAACDAMGIRDTVREMKERIEADLAERGKLWGEVKLGVGSIRDIEFVAQYLQLRHCDKLPMLLERNTLSALRQLHEHTILSEHDYRILSQGYTFLRPLEHYLQLMDYHQLHSVPQSAGELDQLARRLGFSGDTAGSVLLAHYQQHANAIRQVFDEQFYDKSSPSSADAEGLAPQVVRHLERLSPSYRETFTDAEIQHHAELIGRLRPDNLVEIEAVTLPSGQISLTVVGYDFPGELPVICGLIRAYEFNIEDGNIFTYEPLAEDEQHTSEDSTRKIVDVLTLTDTLLARSENTWQHYHDDLEYFIAELQAGRSLAVHTELAKRIAVTIPPTSGTVPHLQPIETKVDNKTSARYTMLHIEAADTLGFLYEVTNALALMDFQISMVTVDTTGRRAHDIFWLTDRDGAKVTAENRQHELTTAVILVKHFTHLLPHSPNPESALLHFRELLGELMRRENWMHELASLERPEVLARVARLLGVSDFLWDDFLRLQYDSLFPLVSDINELRLVKNREALRSELRSELGQAQDDAARIDALNRFKDREIFRIDLRHIHELVPEFTHFALELTDLADVVLVEAIELAIARVAAQLGDAPQPSRWCLSALGKCGGREMGYASDIELIFVYEASDALAGVFYQQVVTELLNVIRSRQAGIFTIDLQLRPYGSAGSLAVSLESFRTYYAPTGPAWPYERQALIKLRPLAGDEALCSTLTALRDEYLYQSGAVDLPAVRAMRERQVRNLVQGGTINIKFSPGGTVDAEYLVQILQLAYGASRPELRRTNTFEAIDALLSAGLIQTAQHNALVDAYMLLRRTVDALRMVRGNTFDLTVPEVHTDEFAYLARRLGLGHDTAAYYARLVEAIRTILALQNSLWAGL